MQTMTVLTLLVFHRTAATEGLKTDCALCTIVTDGTRCCNTGPSDGSKGVDQGAKAVFAEECCTRKWGMAGCPDDAPAGYCYDTKCELEDEAGQSCTDATAEGNECSDTCIAPDSPPSPPPSPSPSPPPSASPWIIKIEHGPGPGPRAPGMRKITADTKKLYSCTAVYRIQ